MGSVFNTGKRFRWQNMSTATTYEDFIGVKGLMGYHQTATRYPNIATCEDITDGYWGRDWQGNLITTSTNIRHHKMPGPELQSPDLSNRIGSRTGIEFSNVTYPNTDVTGHFFVYGSRQQQRTVLQRGMLVPLENITTFEPSDPNPIGEPTYAYNTEAMRYALDGIGSGSGKPTYAFITPELQFSNIPKDGVYFKLDYINLGSVSGAIPTQETYFNYDVGNYGAVIDDFKTGIFLTKSVESSTRQLNYKVLSNTYLPKTYLGQLLGNSTPSIDSLTMFINNSFNTNIQMITLDSRTKEEQNVDFLYPNTAILGGALMADIDIYNNLFAIEYYPANNCIQTLNDVGKYTTYVGDTFMSYFNHVEFGYAQNGAGDTKLDAVFTTVLFPNSDYNSEYRHGSSTEAKYTYWQPDYTINHRIARRYLAKKYYEESEDVMSIYPESYNYNYSYSFLNSINVFRPLAFNHEMCNACLEKFPYRIYYSQNDNQESSEDKYRTIYVNNYRDLEGSKGAITDLFINFEQLYATTPSTIYHIPTRPQVIKTEGVNTYLGTGEALSIPPVQLKSTEYSFGGNEHFKSRTGTEYGTYYVDSISKRPILLTNQIEDISLDGMRSYWQNNAGLQLHEQFCQLTGEDFPFIATTSKAGVGYISTYDTRHKRIISHKRDFRILPE